MSRRAPAPGRPGSTPTLASSLVLIVASLAVALAACIDTNRPDAETCQAPSIVVELMLDEQSLDPDNPAVCRDQQVTLDIDARVDGALHLHGYEAEAPAIEVRAGESARLTFVASRAGQFPIELHTDQNPEGTTMGILTVHEP
jgi:hypothetical protein